MHLLNNNLNLSVFIPILVLFVLLALLWHHFTNSPAGQFRKTTYHKITHNSYRKIQQDKGAHGEYQIYQNLASYERDGAKFLFNCYLPWRSGETTEVDAMMIHHSGIYVFESKNYGGVIAGKEADEYWTQTLPAKGHSTTQNSFFNPILQNRSHISCLKELLSREFRDLSAQNGRNKISAAASNGSASGTYKSANSGSAPSRYGNARQTKKDVPIHSVIVFSDHCDLKSVPKRTTESITATYSTLPKTVAPIASKKRHALSAEEVEQIANLLYPCTQVSTAQKHRHIKSVQKHASQSQTQSAGKSTKPTPRKTQSHR
ncbi:nuclease-related domain-containing protein [Brotaphodocola sp.]|uniref:nuclease-related domain-containing protein n=1 Tax=Brotaphodocola sp. TaxID=3073577 RepID=UPI003D7D2B94